MLQQARPPRGGLVSLERDGGASGLEDFLGLVGRVLGDLLQNNLRSGLDQILGLLETEVGERAHLLDDLDLLVASRVERDVELGLLLDLSGGVATASGRGAGPGGLTLKPLSVIYL